MTRNCIKYSAGYRWQLREDALFITGIKGFEVVTEFLSLTARGELLVKAGYATDGVTGITGTPWALVLERPWMRRGSVGHDAIYQLIRRDFLPRTMRPVADLLLRDWCLEDGAWQWQADLVLQIVSDVAGGAVMPSSERPVLVAP